MKVILIGEYSGVHTNLAKSLKKKNIDVTTLSDGDSYKNFNTDISVKYKKYISKNKFINLMLKIYYLIILYFGINGLIQIIKYIKVLKKIKGYDVVQIINPICLSGYGSIVNYFFFKFLMRNNNKIFLCCLGDDYVWVDGSLKNKKFKSMFYFFRYSKFEQFAHSFKYTHGFFYKKLNKLVLDNSEKYIPGLYDYYYYYKKYEKCTPIVPVAIEMNAEINPLVFDGYPIKIFHGWQPNKEYRKGNYYFDQAIKKIIEKYPNKIEYKVVGGVPYAEYIETFKESQIFLDQCMSMDQGVNGLIAMADGKVVFSGLCSDLVSYYNLDVNNLPLINVEPDVDYIYSKIEEIILNPDLLTKYSKEAMDFISEKHSMDYVADSYIKIWLN